MTDAERDIDVLADEYALGLLDPTEAARVEAEIERDPALRAAVARSRDRFLELDMTAEPAPAPALWERIAARLGAQTADAPSAPPPRPANDNARRWRRSAFAGLAASLMLGVGLVWSLATRPEPVVIAVLMNSAGEPVALIEDYANASARVRPLADIAPPADSALQLWTLPSQEMGPVSLGVFRDVETVTLAGPALPRPREAQLYEITIEQAGGSPTGRPTGPIVGKGFAKAPR